MYGAGVHYSVYSTSTPPLFGSRFINVNDKYFGRDYLTSGLTPYLFAEYRYYTTLDKRAGRGRDTRLVPEPHALGLLVHKPLHGQSVAL